MNSNRQFFAKGRVFFRRIGAALALPRLAACKAPAAFALSLIIALSFAGPPGGALAAAKAPSKEDYEALKEEWRKAQAKEKALAESCPDSQSKTQPVCALNLVEIRVLQEDREKKLTRMEKSLGIKTSFKEKAEEEKTEEKTQAQKTTESAVSKIKKQQKFLKITALVNAGVGGYLLLNHCSPPAQKVGCVLGPLALGQSLISYNQAGKLQTAASQLSGINFPSNKKEETPDLQTEPTVNGKPITETKFPCQAVGAGQGQCRLSPDGMKVQPVNGGKSVGIGELAGMTRIGPADRKAAASALRKALKSQKPLLAKAKDLESDYDPASFLQGAAASPSGAVSSPALSGGTGIAGGKGGGKSAGSFSGASPVSKSGKYGFAPALPAADGEEGGFYDEWAEEEEIPEEESDDSIDEEIENILGRFGGGADKSVEKPKEEKPVSFGKSENIAPSSGNIFSIIKRRYQSYRKKKELVGKVRKKPAR